ncbi:MAG: nucleotidyltransferase domain-containing protein [Candidatus Latescibacteria bacterium]|nr:nucleotidyltransferase domain-containing protein [Candidatus Latescibacterota bacterium]
MASPRFFGLLHVAEGILYGSHVRGEAARDSDVDILVLKSAEN